MAFDAGTALSDDLDPAIVTDSGTSNLGGSEIIRPLKLNCNLALILEKSGNKYSTINLLWLAGLVASVKDSLDSTAVRITNAKIEKARIVRMSGRFRCD